MRSITIVIADDESFALRSEELFIRKEFPELVLVGTASNGIELKQLLEEQEPDLAVVDINMPGLTGIEVIELLRHRGVRTHFVIQTAYSNFDYIKKALDLKTDGYLLKPAKREEKLELYGRLLRLIRKEREEQERREGLDTALEVVNPVLGSEVLLSVFSGQPDRRSFDAYCALNGLRFEYGCIVTFLFKSQETPGRSEIYEVLQEQLREVCEYLAAATENGIVVLFAVPESVDREAQELWCRDVAAIIANDLEARFSAECLPGIGGVYASFADMSLSYRESLDQLRRAGLTEEVWKETDEEHKEEEKGYISGVREYIRRNFARDISLADCAESIGISPYYLSRRFKAQTGESFVGYLTRIRIEEAKRLAEETELTVTEIAEACGYPNSSYFYKVFKRLTGMTIGEYKRRDRDLADGDSLN